MCRTARGEKRAGPGALLAGLRPKGRRGQATRRRRAHPLGSAHTGEEAGDGAVAPLLRLLLTRWLAPAALRRESDDEREGEGENEAKVPKKPAAAGFCSRAKDGRPSDPKDG